MTLYREIADLIVETDGRKVKAVANEILERLCKGALAQAPHARMGTHRYQAFCGNLRV